LSFSVSASSVQTVSATDFRDIKSNHRLVGPVGAITTTLEPAVSSLIAGASPPTRIRREGYGKYNFEQ
jgi:hypothetical protein